MSSAMASVSTVVLLNIFQLGDGLTLDADAIQALRQGLTPAAVKFGGRIVQQSFGVTVESPKRLYWLLYLDYSSLTESKELAVNAEDLPNEVHGFVIALPETHLLQFNAFPKGATSGAPVSEVVAVTLKEEVDIDDFMAYQDTITAAMEKEPAFKGIARSVPDREARTLWVFVGWESKEAHMRWANSNGPLLKRFGESMDPSSGGMVHVPFTVI